MRIWAGLLVCLLLWAGAARAQAVGFMLAMVPDAGGAAVETGIWYPSAKPGGPLLGQHLPFVVMSHGAGGNYTGHVDTAEALARAGFVVAAPTHAGDRGGGSLAQRVRQVSDVVDYVANRWAPGVVDPRRIGAFGYSLGGLTVLVEAGAVPDRGGAIPHDPRVRALVLAAPSIAFGAPGLREVTVPVQLWRADDDTVLPPEEFADVLRGALPRAPEFHTVAHAGHFDFLAPCRDTSRSAPEWCQGEPGFDRAAFHARFNADIVRFYQQALP